MSMERQTRGPHGTERTEQTVKECELRDRKRKRKRQTQCTLSRKPYRLVTEIVKEEKEETTQVERETTSRRGKRMTTCPCFNKRDICSCRNRMCRKEQEERVR